MSQRYPDSVAYARSEPESLWAARQLGIKDLDSTNDLRAIEDYLRKNDPPWVAQQKAAQAQTNDLLGRLEIMSQQNTDNLNNLSTGYENRINDIIASNNANLGRVLDQNRDDIAAMQRSFNEQYSQLDQAYRSLGDEFRNLTGEYQKQGEQLAEVTGLYEEQTRLSNNAMNASVPDAVPSASAPAIGDSRSEQVQKRNRDDNTLSNLTILSGLGTQGNPTAGLQIA